MIISPLVKTTLFHFVQFIDELLSVANFCVNTELNFGTEFENTNELQMGPTLFIRLPYTRCEEKKKAHRAKQVFSGSDTAFFTSSYAFQ